MRPGLTEEMVLNPDALGCKAHSHLYRDWRMYRIEYGFECGCMEGRILLPPKVDPRKIERLLEVINEQKNKRQHPR